MKKNIFMLVMGITLSSIITIDARAQLLGTNSSKKIEDFSMEEGKSAFLLAKERLKAAKAATKSMKADRRALSEFKQEFKDGADVKWTAEKEIITASFNREGVKTKVDYDKNGRWLRTLQVYNEDKMPRNIRELIKRSELYDYRISSVHEIKEGGFHFFIAQLEDDKNYKEICIYEREYKILKEYKKQVL
jgi:hypothetical protein